MGFKHFWMGTVFLNIFEWFKLFELFEWDSFFLNGGRFLNVFEWFLNVFWSSCQVCATWARKAQVQLIYRWFWNKVWAKKSHTFKNWPLIKNPQFLTNPHKTWWKWLPPRWSFSPRFIRIEKNCRFFINGQILNVSRFFPQTSLIAAYL